MRIIAGEQRGRRLQAPKGQGTRPTTDRVRESLMSALSSARGGFDDAVVLDAFAGSGALGLEALSRGAACAHFYEHDAVALRALGANVDALGYDSRRARVFRKDVLKNTFAFARPPFDLVLLDPPYALEAACVVEFLGRLDAADALAEDVLIAYEHLKANDAAVDAAFEASAFAVRSRKKYGDTTIDLFERKQA